MSRALFAGALIVAAPAFAEARYFRAIPDLPLPPGFTENDGAAAFEGADGRLVMAEANGASTPARVRAFYAESLPPLGWSMSPTGGGELVFVRGRERLLLTASGEAPNLKLRVRLALRPASMNAD